MSRMILFLSLAFVSSWASSAVSQAQSGASPKECKYVGEPIVVEGKYCVANIYCDFPTLSMTRAFSCLAVSADSCEQPADCVRKMSESPLRVAMAKVVKVANKASATSESPQSNEIPTAGAAP